VTGALNNGSVRLCALQLPVSCYALVLPLDVASLAQRKNPRATECPGTMENVQLAVGGK